MSKVYDGRQLAIKVAMNAIYGACGTSLDAGAKFLCLDILHMNAVNLLLAASLLSFRQIRLAPT